MPFPGVSEYLRGNVLWPHDSTGNPGVHLQTQLLESRNSWKLGHALRGTHGQYLNLLQAADHHGRVGEGGINVTPHQGRLQRCGSRKGHIIELDPGQLHELQGCKMVAGEFSDPSAGDFSGVGLGIFDEFLEGVRFEILFHGQTDGRIFDDGEDDKIIGLEGHILHEHGLKDDVGNAEPADRVSIRLGRGQLRPAKRSARARESN